MELDAESSSLTAAEALGTPDRSNSLDVISTPTCTSVLRSPASTIVTDSGKKRRLQVISSEWDCVFRNCNGYLTLVGFVDDNGEKTVTSCHCSSAASRGFGDCSAKYLIAKFVTTCKLCKGTLRPVSLKICIRMLINNAEHVGDLTFLIISRVHVSFRIEAFGYTLNVCSI